MRSNFSMWFISWFSSCTLFFSRCNVQNIRTVTVSVKIEHMRVKVAMATGDLYHYNNIAKNSCGVFYLMSPLYQHWVQMSWDTAGEVAKTLVVELYWFQLLSDIGPFDWLTFERCNLSAPRAQLIHRKTSYDILKIIFMNNLCFCEGEIHILKYLGIPNALASFWVQRVLVTQPRPSLVMKI
jgi:hypothetical protein